MAYIRRDACAIKQREHHVRYVGTSVSAREMMEGDERRLEFQGVSNGVEVYPMGRKA